MNQETGAAKFARPLISGEILLCKEENYEGQEQLITANTSRLDFPIASLRIGPKTGVTVFFEENYGGVSQELTAELPSFKKSRLQGNPKSIKIWSAPGKLFTGFWAIDVAEEDPGEKVEKVYLSVAPDGLLTTRSSISVSEEFRFAEGFIGWASSSYLKQVTPVPPPPPGGKYRATANRVHLREGPGTGFRSLGYIQVNEIVTDLGINDNGSWRQILRHDGLRGWVSARYFTLLQSAPSDPGEAIPQDATRKWYRATAKLNVREGPGTSFKAIGSLQGKEIVEALEANPDGSWLRIRRMQDPAEAALGRRKVTLSVADKVIAGQTTTAPSGPMSLDDFRNLTMVNEQEAGFRKFSLVSQDKQWIHYSPEEKHFLKTANADDRTIFCQSIKIAADETQVGELLQGEVALYENPAYWGKAWVFHTSYADFNSIANLNNTISSIQLGLLTGATIYRGAQFSVEDDKKDDKEKDDEKVVNRKGKQDVTSNLSSLVSEQIGEDRISSIEIWQIKEPAALKLSFECRLSQDYHKTGDKFEEYSAYRTTLRLPPTVGKVKIWATDATTIEVDGKSHDVDETEAVELDSPVRGMVITTNAVPDSGASLRTPGLKIRTDTMLDDERIMIYPDQQVHKDLANLKPDALWNATCGTDKDGKPLYVIAHPDDPSQLSPQQQKAANAQEMITKVMSTVQYSTDSSGSRQQTVSPPEELQNRGWVLRFLTYVVSADTLNLREGPGRGYKPMGFLKRNDIVQALEFSADGRWTRVRRLKDDLTGWSSSAYLKTGERYRVTARKLHLREGPGTDFPSLGYVEFNDIVTGIGVDDKGGWRRICRSDGLTGWSAARYFAPIQPLPPSPISTAAFALRFHEVSQEQLKPLLAMAESPDADLAQGFDDWFAQIVNAVKTAVTVTVTAVREGLAFIIEQVNQVVTWVADTAEKVIAFVEGIFGAIGAAIEDVIKWLRFVFDWGDILETRDYLSNAILNELHAIAEKILPAAKKPVENFFRTQKKSIIDKMDETIRALGGSIQDTPTPQDSSGNIFEGVTDTVDWILSKVLGPIQDFSLFALEGIQEGSVNIKIVQFEKDIVKQGFANIATLPEGLNNVFVTLLRNPDKPLLVAAELFKVFRNLLVELLNIGEKVALGLFDLMVDLINEFERMIRANICIPFISDLMKWINPSSGNSGGNMGFSLLDLTSLIVAIPLTAAYKAFYQKAPCKDLPALALGYVDDTLSFISNTSCVISFINGLLSGILDLWATIEASKEAETKAKGIKEGKPGVNPFEIINVLMDVASWIFDITLLFAPEPNTASGQEPEPSWLESYLKFIKGTFVSVIDPLKFLVDAYALSNGGKRFKRWEEQWVISSTVLGIVSLILYIPGIFLSDPEKNSFPEMIAALPDALSVVMLTKDVRYVGLMLVPADIISGAFA